MAIEQGVGTGTEGQWSTSKPKWLRIEVVDSRDGRPLSNVKLPIGMVKWGMNMAARFAPEMKDADVDWDAIGEMIDSGAQGQLVHVEDEEKHQTVDVWLE